MYRNKSTAKWIRPLVLRYVQVKMVTLDSGDYIVKAQVEMVRRFKEKNNES